MNLPYHIWLAGPLLVCVLLIIILRPMAYQQPPKNSWIGQLPPDQARNLHMRGVAIAVALIAFVLLIYAVSFVKGPGVASARL